jgi:hypothetical protein
MKRDRRRTLRLERLEGKALLSAIPGTGPVATPASAGAAGGSVPIHGHLPLAPNSVSHLTSQGTGLRRIRLVGNPHLMTLSTMVSAGLAGETTRLVHPAKATTHILSGGLVHDPILVGTHEAGGSTPFHANLNGLGSSIVHAAGSASVRLPGGGIPGTHSASTAKISAV